MIIPGFHLQLRCPRTYGSCINTFQDHHEDFSKTCLPHFQLSDPMDQKRLLLRWNISVLQMPCPYYQANGLCITFRSQRHMTPASPQHPYISSRVTESCTRAASGGKAMQQAQHFVWTGTLVANDNTSTSRAGEPLPAT